MYDRTLTRRRWLAWTAAAAAGLALRPSPLAAASPRTIATRRNPGCSCCEGWVKHMRAAGYEVTVTDDPELAAYKTSLGVPDDLVSCHTSVSGDYVLEGHIPSDVVDRFLAERPAARGIAVAGMPGGTPGMESHTAEKYDVVAFTREGKTWVYATR